MPRKRKDIPPLKDIFVAGQMLGLSTHLNPDALEKYLATAEDFYYKQLCYAAIEFCRALERRPTTPMTFGGSASPNTGCGPTPPTQKDT